MPKLHELLAVEKNLQNQANKCRHELMVTTFANKRHHFTEKRITFTPSTEGAEPVVEEQSDIQTTVKDEMDWISGMLVKAMDVAHQVDVANTLAKADVVTEDGRQLLQNVPAASLLQMETNLTQVHELIAAIPTQDPAKGFKPDPDRGPGYFKAREVVKNRTKKTPRAFEVSPATKEHPAQATILQEDVPIGTIRELEWSTLITPTVKSQMLDRCEMAMRAVKKARARANEMNLEVKDNLVGKVMLEYVFEPLK